MTLFFPKHAFSFLFGLFAEEVFYEGKLAVLQRENGEWLRRELNPRHEDFQSSALPTELLSHRSTDFSRKVGSQPGRHYAKLLHPSKSERVRACQKELSRWREFPLQCHRAAQQVHVVAPGNLGHTELLEVRREPLRIEQDEFPRPQPIH